MKNISYLFAICFTVFTSILNAQWVHINGPSSDYINSLTVSSNGEGNINLFAGTAGGGIFLSTNDGTSWQALNNGLSEKNVTSLAISDSNIFAGTEHTTTNSTTGQIFHSTNYGVSWQVAGTTFNEEYVKCFAIKDTIIFAGSYIPEGGAIYKSSDNAKTWNRVFLIPHYYGVACLMVKDPYVFAGSFGLRRGLFRTNDNGETWAKVDSTLGFSSLMIDGTNLLAGTTTGVYLSADNGLSWISINGGLPDYVNNYGWITSIAVTPNAAGGNNLFAGTDSAGIFLSVNDGTNWSSIGLSGNYVSALSISATSLFAITYSGLWRRPLSELITGVEDQNNEIPKGFALEQNYPNPFNPTTTIRFQVPNSSFVNLKVYDILGNEVATLMDEEKPIGTYDLTWNASGVSAKGGYASGVYFYRIQAGDFIETKKMILLK